MSILSQAATISHVTTGILVALL